MFRAGGERRGGAAGIGASFFALLIGLGACSGDAGADLDAPPDAEQIARGEQVYQQICSECHSIQPPPRLAPPISHVARHVKGEVDGRAAFTQHIVTYVQDPSEERSLLPAQAIRRFGLMPAQTLSETQLHDAAAYLWVLADSAQGGEGRGGMGGGMHDGGMGGGGMGQGGMGGGMHDGGMGQGDRHRGGMGPDTIGGTF